MATKNKKDSKKNKSYNRKYTKEQKNNIRESVRGIKEVYGDDVKQDTINSILGNIDIETQFKDSNKREHAWTYNNLKSRANNPSYRSISKNFKGWGGKKADYDKLSNEEKLSVMYYGDVEHKDVAGGYGPLQVTSSNYGGNDKTYQQVSSAAEQLGIKPSDGSDFYNGTKLAIQLYKDRGKDFSKHNTVKDLRSNVINPYEKSSHLNDYAQNSFDYFGNDSSEWNELYDDLEYTGDQSINPERITNNPNLDDGTKEELLKINSSEGLQQSTIDSINQSQGSMLDPYLNQDTRSGNLDLSSMIVDQDQNEKKKEIDEQRQKALQFSDNIGSFAKDFNVMKDINFKKG
jgi:hypothetical protein